MTETFEPPLPGAVLMTAEARDAAEILVLQLCCWVEEAKANDTLNIPALHENLEDVSQWIASWQVWTVRLEGRLVGAVRAHQVGDRWQIGRLMVAPDLAGRGLGRWLLQLVERQAPAGVSAFELFTGSSSVRNLRMYRSAGYVRGEPPEAVLAEHITGATYLRKNRSAPTH